MGRPERVDVVAVDDYTEPAAEPGFYAIYLKLSHEPGAAWRECFEEQWRRIPTGLKRRVTVVRDRIRIEIRGDDLVQEQVDFVAHLVERANEALAARHPKRMKETSSQN